MIRILFMDVDGTLTDGRIIISDSGEESKNFSVKDGMGISKAIKMGIIPVIITGRISNCVRLRANELGINECHQKVSDKIQIMTQILTKYGIDKSESAYIGDDINDLECMKLCQLTGAPNDAVTEVLQQVNFVSPHDGGFGAVRDFIEYILDKNKDEYTNDQ